MRKYVIEQGFYSYNAAGDTDDPVSRWIGREVKKFLAEAHIHLPVLLRAANAPPDLLPEVSNAQRADGARMHALPFTHHLIPNM